MKDNYPEWLYREFGTIICDEIHVCGSAEFKNVLFKFAPKYFIGVSGTLNRADRAENVFKYGLGPVVKGQKIKSLVPTIYFVDTKYVGKGINIKDYSRDKHKMLADICQSTARNELIVQNVVKAALAGRHVLILSERVAHVEELHSIIKDRLESAFIKVGKMVGSSKKEEREYAQDAQVLVATSQLLAVGFNNPRLDTLIFATPMQSVVQPVGRVIRQHPDKKPPLVIDLVETSSKGARILAKSRAKKYREKGWTLKHTHLLDDPPPSFQGGKTW
jgi:superfamily II DNA or RNA helicase